MLLIFSDTLRFVRCCLGALLRKRVRSRVSKACEGARVARGRVAEGIERIALARRPSSIDASPGSLIRGAEAPEVSLAPEATLVEVRLESRVEVRFEGPVAAAEGSSCRGRRWRKRWRFDGAIFIGRRRRCGRSRCGKVGKGGEVLLPRRSCAREAER